MPAGVSLDRDRINRDLARRQHGYGRGGRMKIESDEVEIIGGVRGGETLGSPIAITVRNRDFENWRGAMDPWDVDAAEAQKRRVHAPRPGHVDLIGGMKYDRHDLRDILERASARETASRVAAGAMAKELLRAFGIELRSGVISVGAAGDPEYSPSWDELVAVDDDSPMRAVSHEHEPAMIAEVDRAREAGETLGGTIVVAAHGVPIGLGSYIQWDTKLDGRIGQAILSVHAVKAVAVGDGVVDIETHEAHRSQWERSDVTAVPACGVVCEAMLALVLADAMREKFGGDSLGEMRRNYDAYLEQIRAF